MQMKQIRFILVGGNIVPMHSLHFAVLARLAYSLSDYTIIFIRIFNM